MTDQTPMTTPDESALTARLRNLSDKALGVRDGKDGSRQRACELFPAYASAFSRVKDNGRSDAALIAMWRAMQ